MTIERAADFNASIDQVFALLSDETRLTEWREDLLSAERIGPPGPIDGAKYKETLNTPMGKQTATVRVTTRGNEYFGFEVLDGPLKPTGSMTLSSTGSGTHAVYKMDLKPMFGIPSPLDAAAGSYLTAGMEKSLVKLKKLLDG